MQRNIYLEGDLGLKFGTHMALNASSVADAIKLIEVNNDGFRGYLIDAHEKGVGFHIDIAGGRLEYDEEILLPLHEGDITITPVPAGAKGAGKIFAAIIIAVVAFYAMPYLIAGAQMGVTAGGVITMGTTALSTALTVGQFALYGIAASLAMSGLAEIMAPDPATDADQQSSYLFNGSESNVIEGDPVPVLYGRLRVPGQPISFEITNLVPFFTQAENAKIRQREHENIVFST